MRAFDAVASCACVGLRGHEACRNDEGGKQYECAAETHEIILLLAVA